MFQTAKIDPELWHKRLGHPCNQILKSVCNDLPIFRK